MTKIKIRGAKGQDQRHANKESSLIIRFFFFLRFISMYNFTYRNMNNLKIKVQAFVDITNKRNF